MSSGRALRRKRDRWTLWAAYGGKCAVCGCEIDESYHADHIVPWIKTKTTNMHDMQPLCSKCNLKKGSKCS